MRSVILSGAVAAALTLGLSACTNPYDPGQRAIAGGLIGAGSGALIGGLAAGGPGAAMGAAVGGGVGAVVGAAHRRSVALAATSLDGHGRRGVRTYGLRGHLRAGELTQPAAQAVMQRQATRPMLRLDVRRRGEPLRRVGQWDGAPSYPLEHQEQRGETPGPAIGGRRQRHHALPTVCVCRPLHCRARTRVAAGASVGPDGSDLGPLASR